MKNTYHSANAVQVYSLATTMGAVIPGTIPNTWGTTVLQATNLDTSKTALNEANIAYDAAKAAFVAAGETREAARLSTVAAISSIANTIYNNAQVTPAMIASTGLAPRSTTKTKIVPTVPNNLLANPQANGQVTLRWGRNGNPNPVTFNVEGQLDGENWQIVASTTKASIKLNGYTPGTVASFRVTATRNGLTSGTSNVAVIYYEPTPGVELKVAA